MLFKPFHKFKNAIAHLVSPSASLGGKAVKGSLWVFGLQLSNRVFVLIRNVILARLLSPDDFGLFGIAFLSLTTVDTLTEVGIRHALIQKRGDIEPYLNTAWTIQVIRIVALSALLFFSSPFIAEFFNEPRSAIYLQAVSLGLLLRGFYNIRVVYMEKELIFRKYFAFQFSGIFIELIVSVALALVYHSVWALIYGMIAGNLARMITSYLIDPHHPVISFNLKQARELFSFGKWILGSSVLAFLLSQGDSIFVGKVLGVTALGYYQFAYRISNMSVTEVTHVLQQVTFPLFSKLQDNIARLSDAYLRILQLITTMSFFIAGMIFLLAGDFTLLFLGDKWLPMVPVMRVLVWWGATASVSASFTPLFQAIGKPQISTRLHLAQLMAVIALIYPLTSRYGITGTAGAILIASFAMLFIKVHYLIKNIHCGAAKFYKLISLPFLFIIISAVPTFLFRYFVPAVNLIIFFSQLAIFTLSYVAINLTADRYFNYSIRQVINSCFSLIKKDNYATGIKEE